ncbi:DUF2993 domain-containing protein [Streptomyces sp. RPA4-2]|uniref:LmeA family phospholipid-binding protein n=1 Tax=Streptomyces sp. RPA4-2 TaxID=2721244 RepID=UPI00143E707A|nr:DUF2993 domain-containing protein [Streptomyces sp. RPA4-2]QIY63376.1 DUF2993 domain-containing protein [Streptomyces sp. RPA4-2]
MRALRIILVVTVILGGLFVIADRVAVGFAENKAADRIRSSEGLAGTPDVSIEGFPFLTQVAGGELDDVKIGIKDYEASAEGAKGAAGGTIRIDALNAEMHGVRFNGDYSSATANSASGSATVSYAELLKAAKAQPTEVAPAVTAQVVGLSDGGNGKIKVEITATVLGKKLRPVSVLSSVTVVGGNTVKVRADGLPKLGVDLVEGRIRTVTDFEQKIDGLPGGIKLDRIEAAANGVAISVKGSDVKLVG